MSTESDLRKLAERVAELERKSNRMEAAIRDFVASGHPEHCKNMQPYRGCVCGLDELAAALDGEVGRG